LTALDLGTFDRPVLICGGAYGNLQALEALAAFQAGRRHSGYSRHPHR
jgi:hypothetical protein